MITPKLIIIEGPDRTGKTTLGKYFVKRLYDRGQNAVYLKAVYTARLASAMFDYQTNLLDIAQWNIENTDSRVIIDRHWPSNAIYGTICNNQIVFQTGSFQDRIEKLGGIYIFADTDACEEANAREPDLRNPTTSDQFIRVRDAYKGLAEMLARTHNVYKFDYTKKTPDEAFKDIYG